MSDCKEKFDISIVLKFELKTLCLEKKLNLISFPEQNRLFIKKSKCRHDNKYLLNHLAPDGKRKFEGKTAF